MYISFVQVTGLKKILTHSERNFSTIVQLLLLLMMIQISHSQSDLKCPQLSSRQQVFTHLCCNFWRKPAIFLKRHHFEDLGMWFQVSIKKSPQSCSWKPKSMGTKMVIRGIQEQATFKLDFSLQIFKLTGRHCFTRTHNSSVHKKLCHLPFLHHLIWKLHDASIGDH